MGQTETSCDSAERAFAPHPTPLVGDILYSSWGYDQTNVDFFQVVSVTKASVRVREIAKTCVEGRNDRVIPLVNRFTDTDPSGKLYRFRASDDGYGPSYSIKIESFALATQFDGRPKYQTPIGMGH